MAWDIPNIIINLRKEIEESSGDVTDLETRVGTLESTVSPLPGRLTAVEGRITAAEGDIDALQADLDATPVTVTGTTIEIENAASIPAESLTMEVVPTQSGTGDPSPTNVRPITGISTATVETTDGETTNDAEMLLGTTLYGGSVNFNAGTGSKTMASITFDGSEDENWVHESGWPAGAFWLSNALSDAVSVSGTTTLANITCNQCVVVTPASIAGDASTIGIGQGGLYGRSIYVRIRSDITTAAELKEYLAETPLQVVYELATPTTLTLTADKLTLLEGAQTVTGNGGGDITISYQKDNLIGDLKKWILANT